MQKIFKIKDDVFEEYVSRPLVTGDVGTYKIVLVTEYDLVNCSVRITAKRADGVILSDVGTVNGHNAEYVVKSSIYAVEGDVEIRLVIVDRDGNGLTDKALIFNVIANHASGDMQMATNDGHSVADLSLAHIYNYKNPHRVTKSDVGLGNADNTSDMDKPLSNAVKAEFGNVVAMRPDVLNWGIETELSIYTPINECFWFWTDGFEGIDTIVSDGIEYATQTESGASRGLTKDKLYLLKLVGDGYSNGQCVILYEGDKDEFYMSLVSSHTHANKDILDGITGVDTTPTSGSTRLVTSGGVYGALSGKQSTVTGGASTITSSNLTASRALVSNASGKVAVSDVTSTELGYLDGVTSNVQTQLNGKASTSHTHTKSEITDFPTSMKNPNSLTLTMNGTASTYNGELANSKNWYAPTTAGTAGYELVSSGSGAPVWKAPAYAVCSTAAATVAKTVSISNFKLTTGVSVKIKFTYANSAATPTLNVNSTGAKQIAVCTGSSSYTLSSGQTWTAGEIVEFVYNGTYWVAVSSNQGFMQKKYNTVVIGTSASGHTYANADYICTGTNDNTVFQNAINNMPKGGTIKVLAGRYNFAAPIEIPSSNYYSYIIEGEGVSYSTSYVTTMIYCTNHAFAAVKNSAAELTVKNISFYLAGTLSADSPFIKSSGDVTLTDCRITASTTAVSGDTNYIAVLGDVNIQNCDIDITRTFTATSMVCASFIETTNSNSMASIRGCNIKLTNSVTAASITANLSLARSYISVTGCKITLVGKSNNAKAIISEGSGHISNCYIDVSNVYGDISKITGQASPYLDGSFTNNTVIYNNGCYISFAQVMGNYFTGSGTVYFNGIVPIVTGNRFYNYAKNTVVSDSEQGIIFVNNALKYSCAVSSVSSAIVKDNVIFS